MNGERLAGRLVRRKGKNRILAHSMKEIYTALNGKLIKWRGVPGRIRASISKDRIEVISTNGREIVTDSEEFWGKVVPKIVKFAPHLAWISV